MRVMPRVLTTAALVTALAACQQSGDAEPQAAPTTPTAEPTTPSTSPSVTPETSSGATTALFFGDSYFVGGGYTDETNSMAALAAQDLGWTAIIRGAGGTGFVEGNAEYGLSDYLGQIDDGALDVDDPDAVSWLIVEGGGNDKTDDPAVVEEKASEVLAAAIERLPQARTVLIGTMDPTVDGFTDTDAVNAALRAAAEAAGVPFVDPQRWLEGRPELVGPDYDHPLPAGHVLAAQKLADALTAIAAQA